MPTVRIDGTEPDGLLAVEDDQQQGDTLGSATVRLTDTDANRTLAEPGVAVTVDRAGTRTFAGPVIGTQSRDGELSVRAQDARAELKYNELHRVFYNVESSEAVKSAITQQARPLSRTAIHVGSELDPWTSDAPILQLYDGARASLYNWGTNMVFVGLSQGTRGTVRATYTDVPAEAVQADGFYKLLTRLLVANAGAFIGAEIELYTADKTRYRWEIDRPVDGFNSYELPAEEADPEGELSEPGTLQYRFTVDGETTENRGIWIDNAHTIPFRLEARDTDLSTAQVEPTGRIITRRADKRTSDFLNELATEDEVDWWIEDGVLYYQPGASERTPLQIVEGETPVVDYDLDADFADVTNVVTVQGAGDVEVTVSDGQSVDFYGVAARRRTVVDRTIQSEREARERANGILSDEANDDLGMRWRVADESYAVLSPGNNIDIEWPPEGINDTYAVTEIQNNDDGTVTVGVTGSSQTRT